MKKSKTRGVAIQTIADGTGTFIDTKVYGVANKSNTYTPRACLAF